MLNNIDYVKIFHEIKNSITLINSSFQLVAKKHPEVNQFEYWNEAMTEISFLKNMVTQLSSARLYSHPNTIRVSPYTLIHEIGASIRSLAWGSFVCDIELEDNLPLIEVDPPLIRQAVINLVKNACEAMDNTGTAVLRVSCSGNFIHIAVTDHGGGIDPAFADQVLQPFITSKTGGSGLGLSITREIVEAHHGSLTFVSHPGDGCTFTLSIPLRQNETEYPASEES